MRSYDQTGEIVKLIISMSAALLTAGLAAGCGGSSKPAASTKAATAQTASAVAAKASCRNYNPLDSPTLYASDEGTCTIGGTSVDVAMFTSNSNRDKWVKVAKGFGGNFAVGPDWAASADTPEARDTFAKAAGGTSA